MAERDFTTQRWMYGSFYGVLITLLILLHLVPLSVAPGRIPGPDLLSCLTFAWVLRRPHYVPTFLVAVMFLMADMLFMRPIGLWAALVVLAVEFLRIREANQREQTFLTEWAVVVGVLLAMTIVYRLILTVLFVQQVSLGLSLVQLIATAACYPLVVLVSHLVLGVTKMTPNQAEAQGRQR